MIVSENKWIFIGNDDYEDIYFPSDQLEKGQIVTIFELSFITSDKFNHSHFVLINNELRFILSDIQLQKMFIPIEDWRDSKIGLIFK